MNASLLVPRQDFSLRCRFGGFFVALFFAIPVPFAEAEEDWPGTGEVTEALRRAVMFCRSGLSAGGGYASSWPRDLSEGRTEHTASPTVFSIQPPGTTTMGMAFLDAWRATGDPVHAAAAREAAGALLWCQLSSGGWEDDFDFAPDFARRRHFRRDAEAGDTEPGKRKRRSTLDDNKTQSAMRFLLELVHDPAFSGDEELRTALDFAFDGLLAAQMPHGGWPQQYEDPFEQPEGGEIQPDAAASYPESWSREHPEAPYSHLATLNDNNLRNVMGLLLRARELEGEEKGARYLESARRLGDFLLLAQMPAPQRGWAQQYNHKLQPSWARKFEPPAIATVESFGAIETLLDLWVVTGEEKYRVTLPEALDWLEGSRLPEGQWARFYELESNRPLYAVADTYEITHDDSNLPTHYGFKIGSSPAKKIERLREEIARPLDEARARRKPPADAGAWAREAKRHLGRVRSALRNQNKEGVWTVDNVYEASVISRNISAMAAYVEAREKAADGMGE